MIRRTFLIAALVLLGLGTQPARAELLSDLIASGGTIQVGDKLFSDFGYASASPDAPGADGIDVIAIPPGGTDPFGNFGIRFNLAGFDTPGGGSTIFVITFSVEATNPQSLITDAVLSSNLAIAGTPGDDEDPSGDIRETISAEGVGIVGVLDNFVRKTPPPDLEDVTTFAPPGAFQKLFIEKVVQLESTEDGIATVSVIDQSFSQTVIPEPSSIIMGGMGVLFGIGCAWRRRKATA